MTMEGITLNLGLGTSPCVVTIADASGLAPLELPRAFAVDRQPPRPPSDDAVCRFEAALSAGAAPADAKQAIQILRGIVPAPAVPSAEPIVAERPVAVETPVAVERPVVAERPVVSETHVAVELPVIGKTSVPAAIPAVVPSAKTVELVAKPDVARAPSPLQQGRGGLATPNTHGFANASVGAARSVVTVETPAAETPVIVERPVVVETPVAVQTPVSGKEPVPTEAPTRAPSAEPATQEAVAKPDVARAPSPLQQGRGGLATPNTPGSAIASVGAAKSVVTAETPVAETPVIIERPVVIERPAVLEQPVGVERQVAVETPTAAVPSSAVEAPRDEEDLESPAARIQAVPVAVTPPVAETAVPVAPEVAAASAATARTEAIRETVEQVVEAVAGQIVVTPALTHGEGNVRITLKPTVLDGSEISLTAQDGTLTVAIVPTTSEAERLAAAALPRLETALAEHVPAFRHVAVAVAPKKGKSDETA